MNSKINYIPLNAAALETASKYISKEDYADAIHALVRIIYLDEDDREVMNSLSEDAYRLLKLLLPFAEDKLQKYLKRISGLKQYQAEKTKSVDIPTENTDFLDGIEQTEEYKKFISRDR